MKPLQIAIAGAGLIGRRHMALIDASEECAVAAIVDPAPASRELAKARGVAHYGTLEAMFAATRPDGVIVASPNALHVANGLDCVRRGVPALVEKPIADSVEEAMKLVHAAEAAGVALLVGHHRRHSPLITRTREALAQGAVGRIVGVMGSALFHKPDRYFEDGPWRTQPGGGPLLINMVHEVDDLRALCGEIVAVQAIASSATRGYAVEDTVAITLQFASGALGTFLLSDTAASARSWEQTSGEDKSYAHYPGEDCYVVVGTEGTLAVPTMRLSRFEGERSWYVAMRPSVVYAARADPLARQLRHFCAVLRGDATPLVTARDAVRTLEVTLAIGAAAREGRRVSTEIHP
jgi:predicted dehydrogenase